MRDILVRARIFPLWMVAPQYRSFYPERTGVFTPYHQELKGPPRFLCASLHTCHALKTPADPPESRPFSSDSFVLASVIPKTSPSAFLTITVLYHASGECRSPCGLYDSLCTLRAGRSTVCLSFPITQHSVRAVG